MERFYGLDLFSGIGGISLALEPWVRTVAYCEQDGYAQAVLLSRMRDGKLDRAPIWDDVRTLRAEMLPRIDIIFGGFPCQDISVAGRGAGLAGERSGLYFEVLRLIDECQPAFVFLENVPAIRTRGLTAVAESLTSRGYDFRWTLLSAADVGAPHLRNRWWGLASHPDHSRHRLNVQSVRQHGSENAPNLGGNGSIQSLADAAFDRRKEMSIAQSLARSKPGSDSGLSHRAEGEALGSVSSKANLADSHRERREEYGGGEP